eukprot:IDg12301t1
MSSSRYPFRNVIITSIWPVFNSMTESVEKNICIEKGYPCGKGGVEQDLNTDDRYVGTVILDFIGVYFGGFSFDDICSVTIFVNLTLRYIPIYSALDLNACNICFVLRSQPSWSAWRAESHTRI